MYETRIIQTDGMYHLEVKLLGTVMYWGPGRIEQASAHQDILGWLYSSSNLRERGMVLTAKHQEIKQYYSERG